MTKGERAAHVSLWIIGLILIVGGVAFLHVPGAIILAGALLIMFAMLGLNR